METFILYTIVGLTTASIYAIIASGLVLTYTTTGVFNFSHGAIGMLAAFAFWQMHYAWNWPTLLAVFVDLFILCPLLGLLLERFIMRGLSGTSEATKLVVSISLLVAMIGLANIIWKPDVAHNVTAFFGGHKFVIGAVIITWDDILTMSVAILVAVGLRLVLTRSRLGVTMRAVVDDPNLTQLNGADPTRVAQLSWVLGASLAGVGGVLIGTTATLESGSLSLLIVNAYAAAIVGRLRTLPLTFVGAIVLGLMIGYIHGYLPQGQYVISLPAAAPALLLFVVLLALPNRRLRTHTRTREYFPAPTVRGAVLFCVVVLLGGLMMATTMSNIDLPTYAQIFAIGIVALSLVPLVGFAGQISLCQLSFAGVGAVVMAHVGTNGNPLGIVAAVVVCAIVGALVALPALRLSGIYLALATAAFAVILDGYVFSIPDFDVGPWHLGHTTVFPHLMRFSTFHGLGQIDASPLRLFGSSIGTPRGVMILAACSFVLCAAIVCFVRRSRFGRRLLAMRDSEAACATFGLDLLGSRVAVFAMSAALAGFGGAIYATQLGSITADQFSFVTGLPIFMLVVVGGAGFVSAGLFVGVSLNGLFPLMTALAPGLTKYQTLGTGGAGVGLGREPSGIAPQISEGFAALRNDLPVVLVMMGAMVAAWLGRLIRLYPNLVFVGALFVLFVAAVAIASRRRIVALQSEGMREGRSEEIPLEWVGVTVPWTPELLASTEQALNLAAAQHEALDGRSSRRRSEVTADAAS